MTALDDWRVWQTAQGLSARTIDARCWRITELAQYLTADPVGASSSDLARFMAQLAERKGLGGRPLSRSSLATYHSHLKAWFAWLVRTGLREDDPCLRVPAPRVPKRYPRPVTDRELEAIFATPVYRRTRMMMLLAAFQGLRVHEIAKIRGEDVNLLDGQLRVIGKGGVEAVLPLHELVAVEAETYPRRGWWFPSYTGNSANPSGGPVLGRSVSSLVSDVFERAGVDGGAHRLRHWYATTLLNDGANIRIVQSLLRHASLQTTELYTAINTAQQRDAIVNLSMPRTPQLRAV